LRTIEAMPPTLLGRLRAAAAIVMGRRPDAALVADLFPSERSSPPPRGTYEFLLAYSQMPWLRAAVHRVAGGVASVEWKALAVRRGGKVVRDRRLQRAGPALRAKMIHRLAKAGELTELDEHPVLDLLHSPNPFMTGIGFRRLTEMYIDLVGEGFWLIEPDGTFGTPGRLWPMPPHWIRDVPSPRRPTFWVQLPQGGWTGEIPMTSIIWFVDPDPAQPYGRGSGTARALADELETDEYAAKHTKSWFYNSARPDLIVTVEGARDPELRAAEQRWLDRHQGFFRAFKPYFVSRKITVDEIGQTFRDMQFTQLRQHERDTIIQVFGVPPEILGVLESSNRATIDAADYLFSKHVLVPRLELIRETVQERLAPMFDDRLVVEYENPVQEDKAHQLEAAKAQPAALLVNEWREMAGLEALPGRQGKVHLMPVGLFPVDRLDAAPVPVPVEPGEPVDPDDDDDLDELDDDEEPEEVPEGNGDGKRRRLPGREIGLLPAGTSRVAGDTLKWGPEVTKSTAEEIAALVHRVADRMAPRWRRAFLEAIERARGRIDVRALEAALTSGNLYAAQQMLGLDALAADLGGDAGVRALLRATMHAAADAARADLIRRFGVEINFVEHNPNAVAWIQRAGGDLITEITTATRDAVRAIIERSFRQAIAPRDAARLIRDVVGLHSRQVTAVERFRADLVEQGVAGDELERRAAAYAEAQLRRRALTIARTETIGAANMGQQLLWQEGVRQGQLSPERMRKVWIVTQDDRLDTKVCEPMPFLEANKHVAIDGVFTTGDGQQLATPPAHPNCRCAVGLVIVRE
jgi:hypothetical protein